MKKGIYKFLNKWALLLEMIAHNQSQNLSLINGVGKSGLISDFTLPIGLTVLVDVILFNYLKFLPQLDPRIFESLVQVIATLIGFTIVAFFYYLGKIDDRRSDFINSLSSWVRVLDDLISENEQLSKNALDAISKAEDNKKNNIEANDIRLIISRMP